MSLRRALAGMTLTFGIVAALTPAAGLAAGGTTRMVDGDGRAAPGNCAASAAASTTIQSAIDAANPGDTVLVCPGTYTEQVVITVNDLTVRSTGKWTAVIKPRASLPDDFLVGIGDAKGITFQGFKLVAPTTGDCIDVPVGILVIGTRDTIVRGNQIRAAGPNTLGECGFDIGIALGPDFVISGATSVTPSGFDVPTHAAVIFNSVQDFKAAGIVASGQGTIANIQRNSIRYYHLGHTSDDQCLNTVANVTPAGTDVRKQLRKLIDRLPDQGTGIAGPAPFACYAVGILTGFDARAVIKGNRVHSGIDALPALEPLGASTTTPVLLAGIVDLMDEGIHPVRIANNLVYRTIAGIGILVAQNTKVLDNRVVSNVVGLYVDSVDRALVRDNQFKRNWVGVAVLDALLNYFPSYANRFLDNDVRLNFEGSCIDVTLDATNPFAGDRGTDNRWRNNQAEDGSSEPYGICGAIPPVVCGASSRSPLLALLPRRPESQHTNSC
ncbi:MAG: right-handed parallel beta-helix repeat-containing protein [Chloroflexi bacterium]|nr:right-handed parallel beta-helix repeat-containing protein [Chloroflexota bacterium]